MLNGGKDVSALMNAHIITSAVCVCVCMWVCTCAQHSCTIAYPTLAPTTTRSDSPPYKQNVFPLHLCYCALWYSISTLWLSTEHGWSCHLQPGWWRKLYVWALCLILNGKTCLPSHIHHPPGRLSSCFPGLTAAAQQICKSHIHLQQLHSTLTPHCEYFNDAVKIILPI